MQEINITIHVVAGIIALIVGVVSYASKKGGNAHTRAGQLFLGMMGTVILTAAIGVIFFRDRPFLTVITIQSFYMTFSGFRALKYKTNGPGVIDLMAVLFLLATGVTFIWNLQNANIVWHGSVVYYLLIFLFCVGCYDLLRILNVLDWPLAWLPEHFLKMTSAYTALFSAGMGTVLSSWGIYAQIVPAFMGNILLIAVIWRFRKSFRRGVSSSAVGDA